ncbi:unnamed protein product, partial [Brugia timori]
MQVDAAHLLVEARGGDAAAHAARIFAHVAHGDVVERPAVGGRVAEARRVEALPAALEVEAGLELVAPALARHQVRGGELVVDAAVGGVALGIALAHGRGRRNDGDAAGEEAVVAREAAQVVDRPAGAELEAVLPRERLVVARDVGVGNAVVVARGDAEDRLAVDQRHDRAAVAAHARVVELEAGGPVARDGEVAADQQGRLRAAGIALEAVVVTVGHAHVEVAALEVPAVAQAAVEAAVAADGGREAAARALGLHEELRHAADRVLAVERRGRALDELEPVDQVGRDQRDVGIALQQPQRHAVHQHQHVLRVAQAAGLEARVVVALRAVLQPRHAAQRVLERDGAHRVELRAFDRIGGEGQPQRVGFLARGGGDGLAVADGGGRQRAL